MHGRPQTFFQGRANFFQGGQEPTFGLKTTKKILFLAGLGRPGGQEPPFALPCGRPWPHDQRCPEGARGLWPSPWKKVHGHVAHNSLFWYLRLWLFWTARPERKQEDTRGSFQSNWDLICFWLTKFGNNVIARVKRSQSHQYLFFFIFRFFSVKL